MCDLEFVSVGVMVFVVAVVVIVVVIILFLSFWVDQSLMHFSFTMHTHSQTHTLLFITNGVFCCFQAN